MYFKKLYICGQIVQFILHFTMKLNTHTIEHVGIVQAISNSTATILITQQSACSSCHAKAACSAVDSAQKLVEAQTNGQIFHEGQQVLVVGRSVVGLEAVFYAYIIPFILLLVTLILVFEYTHSELYAALLAIGSLLPFYLLLFLFKNKLSKKFSFSVQPIS